MFTTTFVIQGFAVVFFIGSAILWWNAVQYHLVGIMWANVVIMAVNGALFIVQFHIRQRLQNRTRI